MAYDEKLAQKFRNLLPDPGAVDEKKMMGGLCFLVNGNMIGGVGGPKSGDRTFIFRVGKDNDAKASAMECAEPMIMGERRMTGFYIVDVDDCSAKGLRRWMALAYGFASTLPAK